MKILTGTFINYYSDPRAYKIDEGLAKENEVVVLSPITSKNYEKSKAKVVKFSCRFSSTVIELLCFWISFVRLVIKEKPNIVIGHNYYLVFACRLAKILYPKAKYIYDSYEFYVPTKKNKISRNLYFFYLIEKICINSFDLILSANEERSRLMKAKYSLHERPLAIRNITTSFNKDCDLNEILKKYPSIQKLDGTIKLVYQGFIGAGRNIEAFIDIIKELPKNYSLLLIGGGPDLSKLKQKVLDMRIEERVVFVGNVPMKDVFPLLSLCNLGLISYPFTDLNNIYCSPNKIYEYPAAGLAMISSSQTTIINALSKFKITCFVNYNDIKGTVKQILEFTESYEKDSIRERTNLFLQENSWEKEFSKINKRILSFS